MWQLFYDSRDVFFSGMKVTLIASLLAMVMSSFLGLLLAIMQTVENKIINGIAKVYVEFFRNIPLVVIVMFCYVVLPLLGVKLSGFAAGTIGLGIYSSAFIADTFRTGIQAVPAGQLEAARSTGLTYGQTLLYVIIPQAVKIVIPPLGNRFVSMIKDSAILAMVAGFDLMYQADLVASSSFQTFYVYSLVAICYLVLTLPLSRIMKVLEKKWANA